MPFLQFPADIRAGGLHHHLGENPGIRWEAMFSPGDTFDRVAHDWLTPRLDAKGRLAHFLNQN